MPYYDIEPRYMKDTIHLLKSLGFSTVKLNKYRIKVSKNGLSLEYTSNRQYIYKDNKRIGTGLINLLRLYNIYI